MGPAPCPREAFSLFLLIYARFITDLTQFMPVWALFLLKTPPYAPVGGEK